MQITFKRNGIKNYMVVQNDRDGSPCLREKMIVRNNIAYLAKMTPQSIDGHSYYYYDIQGRVNLETVFAGRNMTKNEITAILQGLSGLLSELERYLLSPGEVLFAPSDIWVLPDTLEPAFIYVPDATPDDAHGILAFAEFLTEHVDGNDREAAAIAYGYLEMAETGCIKPDMACAAGQIRESARPYEEPLREERNEPPINPDEYWDIKEGIADEMKPFFEDEDSADNKTVKKKIAYISLGLVIAAAIAYIAMVLDPALFPFSLTDDEYMTAGIAIAVIFAIVLIAVMFLCGKKDSASKDSVSSEEDLAPATYKETKDDLEYMEYRDQDREEDDEKTVLLKRPLSMSRSLSCPVLRYEDGRDISVSTFPFIIGKMKTRVDGVVEGNGVSRIHAMIKEQDGRYYLSDLNSLNGTGINGKTLETNETAEITEGDIISLAGTPLTFHTKAG